MTGWHTVHVRVNDAATGRPTPVRIRVIGPAGLYLAPFGRLADFAMGQGDSLGGNLRVADKSFAYIDGSCEIRLPAETVRLEVSKGPEYKPIRQAVSLGPGKMALRLTIERWIDPRQDGWYSGDTRVHFLSPHAALLEAAAEDVTILNLLALELPHGIDNILAFSGQAPALAMPGHQVVVNTLNHHPVLGELGLLNCHRVVYPLAFGGPRGREDWTLADWCDQCHRKGGLVLWNGFAGWQERAGEPLADLVLGKVDAVNVDGRGGFRRSAFDHWYKLLNAGLRVPLVAGSGKVSNGQAVGERRTYAQVVGPHSYQAWIEAVRAGRVFVSGGPILSLTVDGQLPGSVLEVPADQATIHVKVAARSQVPFERLELIHNGSALAGIEAEGDPCSAAFEVDLPTPGSGWLAARTWQPDATEPINAHTGPIYFHIAGKPFTPDTISLAFLIDHLDWMLDWVEKQARFDTDKQRHDLTHVFQSAREKLVGRMGQF